jgi:ABC-type lipoprotein release transport system permease subunit
VGQVGIDFGFASGMGEVTALMGTRLYPTVGLGNVMFSGVAVTIIAALASLYPAWHASRKEPAAALHHI